LACACASACNDPDNIAVEVVANSMKDASTGPAGNPALPMWPGAWPSSPECTPEQQQLLVKLSAAIGSLLTFCEVPLTFDVGGALRNPVPASDTPSGGRLLFCPGDQRRWWPDPLTRTFVFCDESCKVATKQLQCILQQNPCRVPSADEDDAGFCLP